jgi:cation diffusion facilitator CzcD-associated flavoprotein CzcO
VALEPSQTLCLSCLTLAYRDQSYDWTGKRVAVIGNGSSAIQLVPKVQKTAKELVNYIRNPTWIAANFLEEYSDDGNQTYSEEARKEFREHPEKLFALRKKLEHGCVST